MWIFILHLGFMKMENYEAFVGFDLYKIPLSSVAQKIMSAMHSGDLVESKNWRESEKTSEVVNNSCIKYSVLLEDGKNQSLEKRNLKSFTSQTSRTSIKLCLQPSSIRLTDQLSTYQKQKNISSLAPPSCFIPQCNQEASVLQKMECKRKYYLKENKNNEIKEMPMIFKRKCSTHNFSGKTSEHVALEEDADEVEAYLNCGNSRACENHFCDARYLDDMEKSQLIEMLKQAVTVVVTLMYEDGSTQLKAEQALVPSVEGVAMLLQSHVDSHGPLDVSTSDGVLEEGFTLRDQYIYLKTQHSSTGDHEQEAYNQFARTLCEQCCRFLVMKAAGSMLFIFVYLGMGVATGNKAPTAEMCFLPINKPVPGTQTGQLFTMLWALAVPQRPVCHRLTAHSSFTPQALITLQEEEEQPP
uniref:DNA polymerase nu-like n=1 Tax=Nyctereutes procyonoides TaxID=34880 RepID=UPI002444989D|nr:DNA polymerase nu-like [Nyctereutes procyonoides]